MSGRRALSAGGLFAIVVVIVIVVAAASGGGGSSSGGGFRPDRSLARIRARNLRLRSMIVLLTERKVHRLAPEPVASARPQQHHGAAIAGAEAAKSATSESGTSESSECDPNYEGACLDPNAPDYDCEGGSGNGPDYTGEVIVVGKDHFGLDADGDGIGCESE